jgi:hypothetical protein
MTSQCWPTTSTRSSTSLLNEDERNESTPRLASTKAHPARRSESKEEASDSWPGAEVDRCIGFFRLAPRDDGLGVGVVCDIGRWRMMVMAYMGLFRACEGNIGLVAPGLVFDEGKGKPLPLGSELCGVGVRSSLSSSGIVTENMRVIKIVLRLGSFGMLSLESLRARSVGGFAGVKDLARWLLRRRPSARPKEVVASCILVPRTDESDGRVSSGTMCILFELPL